MNKKGSLIYKGIFVLLLSGLIFYAFISIGESFGSGEVFRKQATANDLALLINEMYALSGDVTFFYGQDTKTYTIIISQNTVTVFSTSLGANDPTRGKASFIGAPLSSVTLSNPQQLIITKKSKTISFLGA